MKKYTIISRISLVLLSSFFSASLFAGERSSSDMASFLSETDGQKNSLVLPAKFLNLVGEMEVFMDSVERCNSRLRLIELDIRHVSIARVELKFVQHLKRLIYECSHNVVSTRLVTSKEQLVHNLQTIAQFLHEMSTVMKNHDDIRVYHVRSLVSEFFHGRLYDNALALILAIPCQESWEVDDAFMHELMVRTAALPECAELARSCEKTYHDYCYTPLAETETKINAGILFLEQLAELLDGMISCLKN